MHQMIIFLAAIVSVVYAATETRWELGCMGPMPTQLMDYMKACKLGEKDLPAPPRSKREIAIETERELPLIARSKRDKTTTTPKPPPPSNLKSADFNNIDCILKQSKVHDDQGISFTTLRRFFDDNYAQGAKQTIIWRKAKKCAENASDYRREANDEVAYFIDCLVDLYQNTKCD